MTDGTIVFSSQLSDRPINDRFQPDEAEAFLRCIQHIDQPSVWLLFKSNTLQTLAIVTVAVVMFCACLAGAYVLTLIGWIGMKQTWQISLLSVGLLHCAAACNTLKARTRSNRCIAFAPTRHRRTERVHADHLPAASAGSNISPKSLRPPIFSVHSRNEVPTMNTFATKILRRAYATLKVDPAHERAADLVEVAEMLRDREKELVTLHEQVGRLPGPRSVNGQALAG